MDMKTSLVEAKGKDAGVYRMLVHFSLRREEGQFVEGVFDGNINAAETRIEKVEDISAYWQKVPHFDKYSQHQIQAVVQVEWDGQLDIKLGSIIAWQGRLDLDLVAGQVGVIPDIKAFTHAVETACLIELRRYCLNEYPSEQFKTEDGYLLRLEGDKWTDGDLVFGRLPCGLPCGTNGEILPGKYHFDEDE